MQVLKQQRILSGLIVMALFACGSDDSPSNPGDGDANVNANTEVANGNAAARACASRLEFPRLQGDGGSYVVTHMDNGEVNYSIEWDIRQRSQRWSCYELYRSNTVNGPGVSRYNPTDGSPQYPYDPELPDGYYFGSDPYWRNGQGFDHGHICPSADRLNTQTANIQTFYLDNMQPQWNSFNAYTWASMEKQVRNLVRRNNYGWCDTLYVCKGGTIGTGGELQQQVYTTLSNGLVVPRYFFCALLMVKNGQYNAIGLLFLHEANDDEALAKYAMSIDELEAKTGIDFFCNLPDRREEVIEAACNPALWNFR